MRRETLAKPGRAASALGNARINRSDGRPVRPHCTTRPTKNRAYFARNGRRIDASSRQEREGKSMTQQTLFDAPATACPRRPWLPLGESTSPATAAKCQVCGSMEEWRDALGRVRCGVCEAETLAKARRMAERAAQLRLGKAEAHASGGRHSHD